MYMELELTLTEVDAGWHIAYCYYCSKPYKMLNWFTPSGCLNCKHTFVD